MTTSRLTIVTALMILFGSAGFAHAQFGGTGGTSGGFGGASGGSSFGSGTGGSSSGGSSSGSSGTFGSRSVGSGTLSGGNRTQTTSNKNGQMNNLSNVGQVSGSERFLQSNRRGAFVGGNAQNAQSLSAQLTGGAAGQNQNGINALLGGLNRNNNRNGNNNNNLLQQQQQGGQNAQPAMRTTLVPAFDYPSPTAGPKFSAELGGRLTSLLKDRATAPIQASVEGRTVVLKGAVATEHDRVLAEKLALLEPGVGSVENDLVVRPKGSSELPAPK